MPDFDLGSTVGGLVIPPTKRRKLETMWVDLIHMSPTNPLFRARAEKYDGKNPFEAIMAARDNVRDDDDRIKVDLIETVFNVCVKDWGGWGEKGEAEPLKDGKTGKVVPCTLENFTVVVREVEGGENLFFDLLNTINNHAWFKIKQSEEEKNFLRPSPAPSTAATKRPTRRGRKAQRG